MPSYDDEYRIFEARLCPGEERIPEPGQVIGSTEPCSGSLVRLTSEVFQCSGPRRHLKTTTNLLGSPGIQDVISGWVPTDHLPEGSGFYEVRFPNGAEGVAWWNKKRTLWEAVEENERGGYSTIGEPCEVTGWRPASRPVTL